MKFLRSKRGLWISGLAIILVMFLFRPGAARLKNRLANSLAQGLQRQVEIGSVHVHLLPRPGFDLENFVVHDDPAFSAEPMLRADEVSASLRLLPLLRARLEVSRLSLTEPSLNLVRNEQGRWNISTILEHAAATPVSPTGHGGSASRPEFPYIEAERARINFKIRSEKKPLALSDADFSLWQDSESTWGMRLTAVPLRTDFNLTDTGVIRANGTWQRAEQLRDTPVQFSILWERAQLGQVSKLISGADRGWRGTVRIETNLSGTPSALTAVADAEVQDFRRYDLAGGDPLRLHTHCAGQYSVDGGALQNIDCTSPIGTGRVSLTGSVQRLQWPAKYDLALEADAVPVAALLGTARRSKKDLPEDLVAGGTLHFRTALTSSGSGAQPAKVEGSGAIENFTVHSASNKTDLALGDVPLLFASDATGPGGKHQRASSGEAPGSHLAIGPFHLDRASNLAIQGILTSQGYRFSASGEAGVQRALRAARTIGFATFSPVADGNAKLDLSMAGDWRGFGPPRIIGSAQLKSTRVELRGLAGPIEIASAVLKLEPDRTEISGLSANAAASHWTGSLSLPRACVSLADCPVSFNLQADEISVTRLRSFLNPSHPTPWYRFLAPESSETPSLFHQLHATGKLAAGRLLLANLVVTRAMAVATLDAGKLHLANLSAETLGGKHDGTWDADFTVKPASYKASGRFQQVALAQLAAAMHDPWIAGSGDGEYQLEARGAAAPELFTIRTGTLAFHLQGGTLNHVVVEGSPLKWHKFSGTLNFEEGLFNLADGRIEALSANYGVAGKATWTRALDFKLTAGRAPGLSITGTLAAPRVSSSTPSPATQANLSR